MKKAVKKTLKKVVVTATALGIVLGGTSDFTQDVLKAGVEVLGETQTSSYGYFYNGNKISVGSDLGNGWAVKDLGVDKGWDDYHLTSGYMSMPYSTHIELLATQDFIVDAEISANMMDGGYFIEVNGDQFGDLNIIHERQLFPNEHYPDDNQNNASNNGLTISNMFGGYNTFNIGIDSESEILKSFTQSELEETKKTKIKVKSISYGRGEQGTPKFIDFEVATDSENSTATTTSVATDSSYGYFYNGNKISVGSDLGNGWAVKDLGDDKGWDDYYLTSEYVSMPYSTHIELLATKDFIVDAEISANMMDGGYFIEVNGDQLGDLNIIHKRQLFPNEHYPDDNENNASNNGLTISNMFAGYNTFNIGIDSESEILKSFTQSELEETMKIKVKSISYGRGEQGTPRFIEFEVIRENEVQITPENNIYYYGWGENTNSDIFPKQLVTVNNADGTTFFRDKDYAVADVIDTNTKIDVGNKYGYMIVKLTPVDNSFEDFRYKFNQDITYNNVPDIESSFPANKKSIYYINDQTKLENSILIEEAVIKYEKELKDFYRQFVLSGDEFNYFARMDIEKFDNLSGAEFKLELDGYWISKFGMVGGKGGYLHEVLGDDLRVEIYDEGSYIQIKEPGLYVFQTVYLPSDDYWSDWSFNDAAGFLYVGDPFYEEAVIEESVLDEAVDEVLDETEKPTESEPLSTTEKEEDSNKTPIIIASFLILIIIVSAILIHKKNKKS